MVKLQVVLDDIRYLVDVEGNKVHVNGKEYTVQEKENSLDVDGTPYTVDIQKEQVIINGIPHSFRTEEEKVEPEKKTRSAPGAVTAMMPGKIVSVAVKEGQSVKEGDVVCILEAMKMENELKAPKGGTVKKVHVSAGSNVERGEVLVEIS
ncbi:MAG: biotin/lipoyl-binding protein [Theionarchaea archaeon]|nr:biotin/lipoyl-binding protein [Theionarchaea archaeon]MBU6999608.1 biotin/lipoyl-binding protein [Theionarchaea archaeon]MBU7020388.1 biotin/lipoyl-binding protein [Theionarchaea archaeon]MBU7035479.1 biotin/lipoyl-binding protein [Theionarchaea archaeon]MBU7041126.1 biotin/lipoyl-binding protein [Theionarchaea archaeon]